jgi:hypothetical protein
MVHTLIDFNQAANFLFGGVYALCGPEWKPLATAVGFFTTAWVFLYILYKKKWFLKV